MRRLWIALFVAAACTTTTPVAHVSAPAGSASPSPPRTPSPEASPVASPILGVFADATPGTPPGPVLSPDGTQAAGAPAGNIEVSGPAGDFVVTPVVGDVIGWLDLTHIVYRLKSDSALYIGVVPSLAGPLVPLNGTPATFEGTLPSTVS